MAEPKTKPTQQSPEAFLKTIEPEAKRQDSLALLQLFTEATGEAGVMWGSSIIGFGVYHVTKGKQVNAWPLVAFSPRKQNLTLYIVTAGMKDDPLWKRLGTYKVSGVCLHINRLTDVDLIILKRLIQKAFAENKLTLGA